MSVPRRILLTTSRNPTPQMRAFCNDLARVIPGIVRVNRGKMGMTQVAEKALEHNVDRVAIIERWQGALDKIEFYQIGASGLVSVPPILYIAGIRLQRDFATKRLKPIHSVVITKSVGDSLEIADSLSEIFSIPVLSEKEALAEYPVAMHVSCDATRRVQITFMLLPQKVEIGPRITLRRVMGEPNE
jgi:rRNA maturation protein Rpf1